MLTFKLGREGEKRGFGFPALVVKPMCVILMLRDGQKLERVTRATHDRNDDSSQDPVTHGWLRGAIDLRDL